MTGPFTVHGQDTLPRLFRHVVAQRGDAVAMREKDLGVWRAITWRQYGERARHAGLGLVALGLRPKDVVSVIADNGPEWLYTDLGTLSVGGVTNGVYTTDSPRQVEYIVNDSGTRFFFAGDDEQLDKVLEVRARCPGLVKIIVFDVEGLHSFKDEQVMSFDELLELGARYEAQHPGAWDRLVEIAKPEDLAILVYTSGTTGPPKGAMLSHRNILFQLGFADFIAEPREGDQQLSFLPLSHIAERTFTVFYPLRTGATVNFAESIDTVPDNIREVAPAVFFAVPRIWEKFYSGVALRMREATTLGSSIYTPRRRDGAFLLFTDDLVWPRPLLGALNLGSAVGRGAVGLAAAPFDRGARARAAFSGVLFSVPELVFLNFRKGSFEYVEPEPGA